ncbi:MAG: 50S ribosomal protein L35 [Candidatus Omnitrophica bacterium]|nr:50S ribosomal protein L35 [Candidatus Omnitrophota bacterium]
MPKLKTNKGARKRLKITKNGKLMRYKPGRRHILTSKSSKRKRKMRRCIQVLGMEAKITKKLLPYG